MGSTVAHDGLHQHAASLQVTATSIIYTTTAVIGVCVRVVAVGVGGCSIRKTALQAGYSANVLGMTRANHCVILHSNQGERAPARVR